MTRVSYWEITGDLHYLPVMLYCYSHFRFSWSIVHITNHDVVLYCIIVLDFCLFVTLWYS